MLVLMGIYLLILLRGFWIGIQARSSFGRLVAGSLTLTFLCTSLLTWAWSPVCCRWWGAPAAGERRRNVGGHPDGWLWHPDGHEYTKSAGAPVMAHVYRCTDALHFLNLSISSSLCRYA